MKSPLWFFGHVCFTALASALVVLTPIVTSAQTPAIRKYSAFGATVYVYSRCSATTDPTVGHYDGMIGAQNQQQFGGPASLYFGLSDPTTSGFDGFYYAKVSSVGVLAFNGTFMTNGMPFGSALIDTTGPACGSPAVIFLWNGTTQPVQNSNGAYLPWTGASEIPVS